jgi:hypothetical protein
MRLLLVSLPLCFLAAFDDTPRPARTAPPEPAAAAAAAAADTAAALPDQAALERLVRTDPIAFMRACIRRYDREVKGYRCTFAKQERIGGKLQRSEIIDVSFRENPFSVLFVWREGARLATKVLFVKGQNDNQLVVRPAGWRGRLVSTVLRDPLGADAKESSRYPMTEFGMREGMLKALAAWGAAQKEGSLKYEYRGKRKIAEAGDRECFILRRSGYRVPEEDGITEATLYYDVETWLQVGSTVKGAEGQLIGDYWFRDIVLNPTFAPGTFTREGLAK